MKLSEVLDKLKETKGITLIIIGIVAGVLCLVLSGIGNGDGTQSSSETEETASSSLAEYSAMEEQRVCAILNAIEGVRSARVMLTFDSGSEYVYDSGNYTRSTPLLLEEYPPKVSGVAVVCVGGDNPDIQIKVIDLICSLYGISSSRISVIGSS